MSHSFETGGSEKQFAMVVAGLRALDVPVTIGCMRRAGPFREGLGDAMEFPAKGGLYAPRAWKSRLKLALAFRAGRIEVGHSFDFYTNLMLIPAAVLARVPVILGSHRQLGTCFRGSQLLAQDIAFRLCTHIVCNSRAAAESLIHRAVPERKITVIPNGLAPEAFAVTATAFPRQPDTLRVGMIARMNNPVKNYPGLLRAAARLLPKFPNLDFLLAGDGPLRPELERQARELGLASHVRFLGDRRDVPGLLASLDVVVSSSLSESLSNSIIEAMAAGLPVVATRVGGNPELVRDGETGLLVPPDDDEALASALERLLTHSDLRSAFGSKAREFALKHFSAASVARQYEELYLRLLHERGKCLGARSSVARGSSSMAADQKIKVAMVAPSLHFVGGQSAQAALLVRKWKQDPEVDVRFIPIDPDFPRGLRWISRVPYLRTVARMPLYFWTLWRAMGSADVAHIFSASYWSFVLAPSPALLVAKLRGVPSLINYHSGEARDHLRNWRTAKAILKRADALVVPSGYLADVFGEFGLRARVAPNCIDERQFHFRLRLPVKPRLVCTRGFGVYYSVHLVVMAFARVKKKFPDASLILAGAGAEERRVRELATELELRDVEFTGPIAWENMATCYDRGDIFVNASWLDNMPISILEAFASGTPVVSTAPEGIQYLIRHRVTGLLSEPGDWQALAEHVILLLERPELAAELSQNAYEESAKYRWSSVRPEWVGLYAALAGRPAKQALEQAPEAMRSGT